MSTAVMLDYMIVIICVFSFNTPVYGGAGNQWTYNGTLGPAHWHEDYPQCGGNHQSPINIDTSSVVFDGTLPQFNLTQLGVTDGVNMTLENVMGHTVEVVLSGSTRMLVSGGGLGGDYEVKQFHFHWGQKDERGSEHDIDNKRFPMEMHIVLYSRNYTNFSEAVDKDNGLAVLAFLFEIGDHNSAFDPMLAHFDDIQHSGNQTSVPTFSLMSLLPASTTSFYRYSGSLTTPPCFESVVWSIFSTHIVLAEDQINRFRHIKRSPPGQAEEDLVDDFRPLQALNRRKVYTNDLNNISSGCAGAGGGVLVMLASLLLSTAI